MHRIEIVIIIVIKFIFLIIKRYNDICITNNKPSRKLQCEEETINLHISF